MKIVIIQNTNPETYPMFEIEKDHLDSIKKVIPQVEIWVIKDKQIATGRTKWYIPRNDMVNTEIILTTPFSLKALVEVNMPNLKWIHLSSAGVDRLPESMKNSKLLVTNSSGVHPIPISETVFGYILMFVRGIHIAFRNQIEKEEWERNFSSLNQQELPGKTIGIAGYGTIGKEIGRLAKLFSMKVLAITSNSGNLDKLLTASDFVVDCLPAAPSTVKFFDQKKFKKMKSSAYFINIGRGKTVDEQALEEALKSGQIKGAAIDVTFEEPLAKSSPLWKLKNIIITPHISAWTPYYMDRVIQIFCENLKAYSANKKMPNLVNKQKGY